MGVHNLEKKPDFESVLSESGVMVVDFFATWCGPCKFVAPKIVELSEKYSNVRFYKVDVDELPAVSEEMDVTAMPTFIVFKDGKEFDKIVGANADAVEAAVKRAL